MFGHILGCQWSHLHKAYASICFHWLRVSKHTRTILWLAQLNMEGGFRCQRGGSLIKDASGASMRTPGVSRLYSMGGYVISLVKQQGGALNLGTF